MKEHVYKDNPQTLNQLKANIRNAMVEIYSAMYRKVKDTNSKLLSFVRGSGKDIGMVFVLH